MEVSREKKKATVTSTSLSGQTAAGSLVNPIREEDLPMAASRPGSVRWEGPVTVGILLPQRDSTVRWDMACVALLHTKALH